MINARIDTYLRGVQDLEETVRRGRLYAEAGADCVYPILAPPPLLAALSTGIGLPVNAVVTPDGPSPPPANSAPWARFGPGLQQRAVTAVAGMTERLREELGAGG